MKNKEIERKFLVDLKMIPFDIIDMEYGDISQGYITSIDETFSFRIRQTLKMDSSKTKIGEKYSQTIKSKETKVRDEYEIELNKEQFSTLWKLCMYNSVHKYRYELPYENHTLELDIYKNELSDLVTIEVEFGTIEECDNFIPPKWFGEEVTEVHAYKNVNLALNKGIEHNYYLIGSQTYEKIEKDFQEKNIQSIIEKSMEVLKEHEHITYLQHISTLALNTMLNKSYDDKVIDEFNNTIRKICVFLINKIRTTEKQK